MNEMGSTSKRGNFEGSFKDVDDDVTRESQRQVVTIFLANLRAQRTVSALLSTRRVPFCFVYFFLFFATGCVNQRQAGPSTTAYAVSPSSQAGPSKAASFATRGNLSFTERAELQRLSSPPPALRYRRSKDDDALRNKRQSQTHSGVTIPLMERDLCPREKVSKARRLFKMIFKELLVDVEAKRTTRIDHDVRMMLKEQNMCVNTDYRVGEVPGILVGDEFEYKTEMSVVGLHFGIMSGIDCQEMSTGLIFATSIVASEGSQYRNVFKGDQYSGVGKGLLKGNMALVNNMKHKAPVRVICGTIHHGNKQMFVYLGLYLVKSYERGAEGRFQFLLETA
ncbi:hypothetical protein F2Q69_00024115 [Brassica cretica]|uniref:YDG domain-containing protein n=1 Tax=Brassica cretica TaxID=69181 RepID=A0A8S9Q6K3_BRACR|nr:hypothetical protein F2Q69_00024115 [Brassica cretica]